MPPPVTHIPELDATGRLYGTCTMSAPAVDLRPQRTLKGDIVADLNFTEADLLEQARGNQSAFFHLSVRWAKERDQSVDRWAKFVGDDFAPSWDEMGDAASALRVARQTAMNMATTADMRPVSVEGDEGRAELIIEGPEQEWLDRFGTAIADLDRTNELIFRAIAQRRGLSVETRRDGGNLHLIFAR